MNLKTQMQIKTLSKNGSPKSKKLKNKNEKINVIITIN